MGFTRFVEVGRVALISFGENQGSLCTIVDILDGQKVLVDGPQSATGVHRQVMLLKRLALTDIVIKIGKNCSQKKLVAAWAKEGVQAKWDATAWAKKLANKKKRAALTDFDRYKVMVAKKQRAAATK